MTLNDPATNVRMFLHAWRNHEGELKAESPYMVSVRPIGGSYTYLRSEDVQALLSELQYLRVTVGAQEEHMDDLEDQLDQLFEARRRV